MSLLTYTRNECVEKHQRGGLVANVFSASYITWVAGICISERRRCGGCLAGSDQRKKRHLHSQEPRNWFPPQRRSRSERKSVRMTERVMDEEMCSAEMPTYAAFWVALDTRALLEVSQSFYGLQDDFWTNSKEALHLALMKMTIQKSTLISIAKKIYIAEKVREMLFVIYLLNCKYILCSSKWIKKLCMFKMSLLSVVEMLNFTNYC